MNTGLMDTDRQAHLTRDSLGRGIGAPDSPPGTFVGIFLSLKGFLRFILFYAYECLVCMYVSVPCACLQEDLESPGTRVQIAVSHPTG